MATRAVWKGAISFGLVHIPVALHPATLNSGLDFDWLDKRTLDPVDYRRINMTTGEEIEPENIRGDEIRSWENLGLPPDSPGNRKAA